MKTSPEHDKLLDEVLSDENSSKFRTRSLDEILSAARKKRRRRCAVRYASAVAVLGILTAMLWYQPARPTQTSAIQPPLVATGTVPGTSIRLVSDEELLAMFPDRPVALVGPPENQQFVFLDEKRALQPRNAQPARAHRL